MNNHSKIVVIGSGPAGLTAALYTGRAYLKPIIFEGNQPGGQLTITGEVENYPGFPDGINGQELMNLFRKQAERFDVKILSKEVTKVDFSKRPFRLFSMEDEYTADAVIIATGSSARLLGIESEKKYFGHGVSTCATCDGFFFRGLKVAVIGGGDTALEEALHLTKFAEKVTIIHRRDQLRSSKIMQERAINNPKISFLWNSVVEEILGTDESYKKKVTGLKLRNIKTQEVYTLSVDGVFVAIGHEPNTKIFANQIMIDEKGYIITKPKSTSTNIPGVFAAGDVADPVYRQAITAAGSGCMAAIEAERMLDSLHY